MQRADGRTGDRHERAGVELESRRGVVAAAANGEAEVCGGGGDGILWWPVGIGSGEDRALVVPDLGSGGAVGDTGEHPGQPFEWIGGSRGAGRPVAVAAPASPPRCRRWLAGHKPCVFEYRKV